MKRIVKPGHKVTALLRDPASIRPPEDGETDDRRFSVLQGLLNARLAAAPLDMNRNKVVRNLFDTLLDKAKAREELHAEQSGRCAFCERTIQAAAPASHRQKPAAMRIAHWRPLSKHPSLALTWENLFGSCHAADEPHCDLAQSEADPVDLATDVPYPTPAEQDYSTWLKLLSDGSLEPVDDAPPHVAAVLAMLNLNARNLRTARSAAVAALQRHLDAVYPGRDLSRESLLASLARVDHRGAPFVTAQRLWLTRRLTRAR